MENTPSPGSPAVMTLVLTGKLLSCSMGSEPLDLLRGHPPEEGHPGEGGRVGITSEIKRSRSEVRITKRVLLRSVGQRWAALSRRLPRKTTTRRTTTPTVTNCKSLSGPWAPTTSAATKASASAA
jgi:hypothetical protein